MRHVSELEEGLRDWPRRFVAERWPPGTVVSRGRVHHPAALPGFVALVGSRPAGLVTYRIEGEACEVVTIDSRVEGLGIGSALLDAVERTAREAGCARLWLITTNDNLRALRFYQRRGLALSALDRDALDRSRAMNPRIPRVGRDGIPLRDELELEKRLADPGPRGRGTPAP